MIKNKYFFKLTLVYFTLILISNQFLLKSQAKLKTKVESDNFLNEYCIEIVNAIKEAYQTQIISLKKSNDLKNSENKVIA